MNFYTHTKLQPAEVSASGVAGLRPDVEDADSFPLALRGCRAERVILCRDEQAQSPRWTLLKMKKSKPAQVAARSRVSAQESRRLRRIAASCFTPEMAVEKNKNPTAKAVTKKKGPTKG